MRKQQLDFLRHQLVPAMQQIPADAKGEWGVLNGQQMMEHFIDAIRMASGKLVLPKITPTPQLNRLKAFLLSDIPFKQNTKNPMMSEQPAPMRLGSKAEAIIILQHELDYFFTLFEANTSLTTENAFFGTLTFEENVHLLHKHALHHLKQFKAIA
ncbi:hypothetical protein [Limnovirga soli]|jgi:hypothetical protein|uniref:DUF1569 domain-containing protein n=1 Tax=Limnovirga soli TaxID=2656915 RepID=A0A8J8JRM8_9BACT|nr:hypothetical protein [Limnovirga soli]NNV56042.1 hypothetical protein [Limnovirga soli]